MRGGEEIERTEPDLDSSFKEWSHSEWPRTQVQDRVLTDKQGKEGFKRLNDLPEVTNPWRPQDMAEQGYGMKSLEIRTQRRVCCSIWGLVVLLCALNFSLSAGLFPSVYKHAHISKQRKILFF